MEHVFMLGYINPNDKLLNEMSSPPLQIQFGCVFCSSLLAPEAYILSMIGEEFNLWFPFAGRMHLCDFGRSIKDIPWSLSTKDGTGYAIYIIYIYIHQNH